MSNGEDLFTPREHHASAPSFEAALRGYDKRQVDRYVEEVDIQVATLATDRDRAYAHIQELTSQLRQAQVELAELRQRPPQLDRATFRDLGPTVDQILALAEKQAAEINETASTRAADLQAEAQRVLNEAREQADRLRADSEAAHEHARQETEAARAQAQQELSQLRTEVEEQIDERQQALNELRAELDSAQQQLIESRQEVASADHEYQQLQHRIGEARQDLAAELDRLEEARRAAETAEQHAKAVRARVQREAKRVADLAAAAVIAAAERGGETGEYPMVVRPQRDQAGDPPGGLFEPARAVPESPAELAAELAAELPAEFAAQPPGPAAVPAGAGAGGGGGIPGGPGAGEAGAERASVDTIRSEAATARAGTFDEELPAGPGRYGEGAAGPEPQRRYGLPGQDTGPVAGGLRVPERPRLPGDLPTHDLPVAGLRGHEDQVSSEPPIARPVAD